MSRKRDIDLGELSGMEAEEEFDPELMKAALEASQDEGHLGVGTFGMCWLNGDRVCEQNCMAFDSHRLDAMEHPCSALSALQGLIDPQMEQRDELIRASNSLATSVAEATRSMNNLVAGIQQAAQRIR